MNCSQCGCELNAEAKFCNRCGTRVGTAWTGTPGGMSTPGAMPGAGPYGQAFTGWQPGMAGGGAASVAAAYLIPKEEMQRRRVAGNLQPLGITWCLWGVYRLIAGVAASVAVHALSQHGMWPGDNNNFLPGLFQALVPVIALTTAVMAMLSMLTGYALLAAKPWARTLAIIMAILNLIKIPLGTTLGIYTLWVLAPRAAGLEYDRLSTPA